MTRQLLLTFSLALLFISTAPAQTVDFSSAIAPILFGNCTTCHRVGEVGPFPLITYNDAVTYGYGIQTMVNARKMPPWPANPAFRHFKDEMVLTLDEIDLINEWVNGGMPEGNPNDLPPVPVFPEGSQLGEPDTVYTWTGPFTTLGNFENTYRNMVIDVALTGDKWIRGIEFRPDQTKYIHHADFYLDTSGKAKALDDLDPGPGFDPFTAPFWFPVADVLLNWSPGMNAHMWPEGMGKKLPANSHIVVDIHYAPVEFPVTDLSEINIFFTEDPIREIRMNDLIYDVTNWSPKIAKDQVKTFYAEREFTKDKSLMAVSPHMHLLGDSMISMAVTPDNDTIPLVAVDYDFNWQYMYTYQYLIKIPAGSVAYTESTFDNTVNNPNNPNDPPDNVYWGAKTEDEMNILFTQELDYLEGDEFFLLDSSLQVPTGLTGAALLPLPAVTVFPNPADDVAKITLHQPGLDYIHFRITDLTGRTLLSFERDPHGLPLVQYQFSVNQLLPGLYLLHAAGNGLDETVPLIVK